MPLYRAQSTLWDHTVNQKQTQKKRKEKKLFLSAAFPAAPRVALNIVPSTIRAALYEQIRFKPLTVIKAPLILFITITHAVKTGIVPSQCNDRQHC